MSERGEQTEKRVAQYLHPYSLLFETSVENSSSRYGIPPYFGALNFLDAAVLHKYFLSIYVQDADMAYKLIDATSLLIRALTYRLLTIYKLYTCKLSRPCKRRRI